MYVSLAVKGVHHLKRYKTWYRIKIKVTYSFKFIALRHGLIIMKVESGLAAGLCCFAHVARGEVSDGGAMAPGWAVPCTAVASMVNHSAGRAKGRPCRWWFIGRKVLRGGGFRSGMWGSCRCVLENVTCESVQYLKFRLPTYIIRP